MTRSNKTIGELLEEIRNSLPKFKKGLILETIVSIYPTNGEGKISYGNISFTKPMALSRKDKQKIVKENSPLKGFFREFTRGDFLKVIDVIDGKAVCLNVSIKKEIRDGFYKNEYITIEQKDLIDGTVKPYRRKIEKFYVVKTSV